MESDDSQLCSESETLINTTVDTHVTRLTHVQSQLISTNLQMMLQFISYFEVSCPVCWSSYSTHLKQLSEHRR